MSCYIRHMEELISEAGIENTKINRKKIDSYLKNKFNLQDNIRSCPEVWKLYIKPILHDNDKTKEFIKEIKIAVNA